LLPGIVVDARQADALVIRGAWYYSHDKVRTSCVAIVSYVVLHVGKTRQT
jgi:hypothetical protein